jgi:hypothetical protein
LTNLKILTVFSGLSKTIQNELLESILAVTQTLIKKEIDESDYIAIQADETTDNAKKYLKCIFLKYIY